MKYSYFPGCSLEHNAEAYDSSSRAIAGPLGLELMEIDDWNCCGATEYISLNMTAAYALVARNLAQATKNGLDQVIAPCSACYLNLSKCDRYMRTSPKLADRVNTALAAGGLSYQGGTLRVRHLIDVITEDVGLKTLASKVTRPLKGVRVAPYYGCLISRPGLRTAEHNPEYPVTLDQILEALGAEVVDFPLKTHCCGGHMTQISESTGFDLIRQLVKGATDYQADIIVTVCPMCHLNLDAFQAPMNNYFKTNYQMPVAYFTQMIGLAFGMSAHQMGFGTSLISAGPALAKIGEELPAPAPEAGAHKRKRDDKSLPMPTPLPTAEGEMGRGKRSNQGVSR